MMGRKDDELDESYNLLCEKIERLRRDHAIETDTSIKFKLEKQIEEAENERNEIEQQLGNIEVKQVATVENKEVEDKMGAETLKECTESSGEKGSFEQLLRALKDRDFNGAEEYYRKIQGSRTDNEQDVNFEALYLYLRYRYGDTAALAKLKELTKEPKTSKYAYHWIGSCYEYSNSFEKAAEAYQIELQQETSEERRANAVVATARCLFSAEQKQEAYKILMHHINQVTSPEALSTLYKGLAFLYEKDQNPEFRAIALEKVLENNPNNVDLLFDIAHSYSEVKNDEVALLHYSNLLKFNSIHETALNNLAVQYSKLGMPISSVKYYKKAFDLGATLAAANFASALLNAGFIEEAESILNKARQKENPHKNVDQVLAAIPQKQKYETDLQKDILKSAQKQRRFFLSFAEAYFSEESDKEIFTGRWNFPDGINLESTLYSSTSLEIEIIQTHEKVEAEWIQYTKWKKDKLEHKYKLEGQVSNRAAKVNFYKWDSYYKRFEKQKNEYG